MMPSCSTCPQGCYHCDLGPICQGIPSRLMLNLPAQSAGVVFPEGAKLLGEVIHPAAPEGVGGETVRSETERITKTMSAEIAKAEKEITRLEESYHGPEERRYRQHAKELLGGEG